MVEFEILNNKSDINEKSNINEKYDINGILLTRSTLFKILILGEVTLFLLLLRAYLKL